MEQYKILLVDDERTEREGISFLIERYGYPLEIHQAVNGKKALEAMEAEGFDILFTDIKMPIMDGLDLSKEVAARYPETVIIIFSAYSEFDYAKKAMEAGVVNYLLKPIELEEFQLCMERVLKRLQEKRTLAQVQQEREVVQQAQVYRFFSSKKISQKEKAPLEDFLFNGGKSKLAFIFFEFEENHFEQRGVDFSEYIKAYFQHSSFLQITENEAYILLHKLEFNDEDYIRQQGEKLLAAVGIKQGYLGIVSQFTASLEELVAQLLAVETMRKEVFIHQNRILSVSKHKDMVSFYKDNLEEIKNRIFASIQQGSLAEISGECEILITSLSEASDVSRVYVQHLLYSIVKELYARMPLLESEDSFAEMNRLFDEKNPSKVLDNFRQAVNTILTVAHTKHDEQNSDLVRRIKNFIQKEYKGELSLFDVATKLNLNSSYVSHIFKKETGQGIVEYITELKMEKARLLLQDKNLKIVQIAEKLGYNSQSYFNKCFKSHFGITPKQFREGI